MVLAFSVILHKFGYLLFSLGEDVLVLLGSFAGMSAFTIIGIVALFYILWVFVPPFKSFILASWKIILIIVIIMAVIVCLGAFVSASRPPILIKIHNASQLHQDYSHDNLLNLDMSVSGHYGNWNNPDGNITINNITITTFCIGSCYTKDDFANYLKNQTLEVFNLWDIRWYKPDNSTKIAYQNITNLPTCPAGSHLFFDGTDLICSASGNSSWNQSFADTLYSKYYPSAVNLTTATYTGNLTYGGNSNGYATATAICNSEFSGSHMCDESEISEWFAINGGMSVNGDAWCNAGGPKYVPATIPVNDCNGWNYNGTVSYLGNYWHFDSTNGGTGRAINCGTSLSLACCSY